MKIFDTYPGGKGADGTYQTLINLIPPHDVKVSGFLGNCAITRFMRPAEVNIGVDKDKNVIDRWKSVSGKNAKDLFGDNPLPPTLPGDKQLDLFGCSFLDYMAKWGHSWNYPDCFFFLDPPYPIDERKSKEKIYQHEMTNNDHMELLRMVVSMRAMVMICTYDNEMYREYLNGWKKVSYKSKTRRGSVIETVYMNYAQTGKLHDYSFLGKDFIERQRIRRKVDRHVNKLQGLPVLERNAILTELSKLK